MDDLPTDTSSDVISERDRDRAVIALRNHRDKEKNRRRKQRQRVKDELESLRRKDDELTRQLNKLKLRKETRIAKGEQHYIWKEVALMHREERLKSETEQRRLTATIKMQANYIDNLRGLFHQDSTTFNNALQDPVVNDATDSQHGDSEVALFTTLLEKIGSCYARFDDVLNGCGVVTMPLGVVNTAHWRDESGELEFYQSLHKFELPSELAISNQYCWKAFNLPQHRLDREDYSGFRNAENTVAMKHRMVRTLTSGTTVSVLQHYVARRFIEEDRVVFIWKTYTEGEGMFRGMHSNQTGWSCIRPLPDRPGTVGDVCIREFPVLSNTSPPTVSEFHQFLRATVNEDNQEVMTTIHKRLGLRRCLSEAP
ncbi:hypothetical protein PHMEG_00033536 [Phytophthora megakarya]|uniref:M96 mating-specific protein n=1 Tax=Phytophthora megakarya TaxID=4795 RepID=A0A225UUM9_9STRA|nr:hypothetical protein PHMEG_00033536 [Phytophthora megakarya]